MSKDVEVFEGEVVDGELVEDQQLIFWDSWNGVDGRKYFKLTVTDAWYRRAPNSLQDDLSTTLTQLREIVARELPAHKPPVRPQRVHFDGCSCERCRSGLGLFG